MSAAVTVAVPVGPSAANRRWLPECLASVAAQTRPADEVLLVDDGAGLAEDDLRPLWEKEGRERTVWAHLAPGVKRSDDDGGITLARKIPESSTYESYARVWRSPWRLGVACAFNFGVALARGDLVFLLGSDDELEPDCLERCVREWEKGKGRDAYYWVSVLYTDGREYPVQDLPCNAAMVTKGLWRQTGGFPVETASGAPDAALISILMAHRPELLVPVARGRPLYRYRAHGETDTAGRGPWQGIILATRDLLTATWRERDV